MQKSAYPSSPVELVSRFIFLFCLILALAAPNLHGASKVWSRSKSPGGGDISAIAICPQNPSTLYAGTYSGLFKSTDAGLSWNAINNGLSYESIESLAIDPLNPATVYAGTPYRVFKSTNGGMNWSAAWRDHTDPINTLAIDHSLGRFLSFMRAGFGQATQPKVSARACPDW